jgi:SsrA-binding protein
MATKKTTKTAGGALIAQNRKALHDYEIVQRFEAGIVLTGSEIKAVREHRVQLQGAYARVKDGEVWLQDAHIAVYQNAGYSGHVPTRDRKLLLHGKEITRISQLAGEQGLTLVPLSMYFKNGRAKVEIALARGLKRYDKRERIAERDVQRDVQRALRQKV